LHYYGRVPLGLSEDEFWLMPFGAFMDMWECHKQYEGISKPKKQTYIEEVIPDFLN